MTDLESRVALLEEQAMFLFAHNRALRTLLEAHVINSGDIDALRHFVPPLVQSLVRNNACNVEQGNKIQELVFQILTNAELVAQCCSPAPEGAVN